MMPSSPITPQTIEQQGLGNSAVDELQKESTRLALQKFLEQNVRHATEPVSNEKVYQYRNARLNDLYFRGKQYVQMYMVQGEMKYRVTNNESRVSPNEVLDNPFLYDYIFPLFQSCVLKLASVIGTRAPNLQAAARIPGNQGQIRRSRIAQRFDSYLSGHWNKDAIQPNLYQILALHGTAFGYVHWNTDASRYGQTAQYAPADPGGFVCQNCWSQVPVADAEQAGMACPNCGSQITQDMYQPSIERVQVGQQQIPIGFTPNGAVELRLGSILTVDVPYYMGGIHETPNSTLDSVSYLIEEYETSKWNLLAQYKDYNQELLQHMNESLQPSPLSKASPQLSSNVRQASLSPSGTRALVTGINDLWLHTGVWITEKMYDGLSIQDRSGNLSEIMRQNFPNGAKFCYVNSRLVGIYPEKLTAHWSMCKPGISPGIYGDPIFDDVRQACDVANDALNILVQAMEHSVGEVAYDKGIIDSKYLRDNRAEFGTWLGVVPTSGRALADHFFRIPGATLDESLWNFIQSYMDKVLEAKGIVPSLFGGGSVEQTARGAEIRRNQALAQHVPIWRNMGAFHEAISQNAAMIAAEKSGGKLYLNARSQAEEIDIESIDELLAGGWTYNAEETMPLTPGQRRDWIFDLTNNQAAATLLSLVDPTTGQPIPQNLDKMKEAAAIEDWYIVNMDQYNRAMDVVHQLLQQPPVQMPDPMTGAIMSQPAIPPDPLLFDGPFVINTVRGWMQSDEGREQSEENPSGYAHVRSYLEAWNQFMQQQQAMMMAQQAAVNGPGGPPPGGGGPPPPGGGAGAPPPQQAGSGDELGDQVDAGAAALQA